VPTTEYGARRTRPGALSALFVVDVPGGAPTRRLTVWRSWCPTMSMPTMFSSGSNISQHDEIDPTMMVSQQLRERTPNFAAVAERALGHGPWLPARRLGNTTRSRERVRGDRVGMLVVMSTVACPVSCRRAATPPITTYDTW
jgi:hypothetical protein